VGFALAGFPLPSAAGKINENVKKNLKVIFLFFHAKSQRRYERYVSIIFNLCGICDFAPLRDIFISRQHTKTINTLFTQCITSLPLLRLCAFA
jgi:hypothetical protein